MVTFFSLKKLTMYQQNINKSTDLHQMMEAYHGIPIVGKAVFILISLMFHDQKVVFDFPAIATDLETTSFYIRFRNLFSRDPNIPCCV